MDSNCSTGSVGLFRALQAVEPGVAECVSTLGFERMHRRAVAARPH